MSTLWPAQPGLARGVPSSRGRPGVGVDVVEVAGLARRLAAQPGLDELLFTPAERVAAQRAPQPAGVLAACFAAKEAFVKALGRGFNATGPDAWLQQLEVVAPPAAAPTLTLGAGPARAWARRATAPPRLALSVAGGFALATVLLLPEREHGPGAGRQGT